ncbi:hypothetical protein KKC08_05450 [Patescibacteria group bacterium]|nr:hypothetical protein [Patescibacteria group bacterium]MCG2701717.1 Mur ligase domain-containing protein [Candidatus Parcubacteria bacterium]MBU4264622.1 hypothetical protein [Patescibacteria group bacterium]MBU4390577.1 hypothetical protein [Patescibacteria group bacterium]MBU4397582.1 hypothetical protein [Patescibacteria group bacterium]
MKVHILAITGSMTTPLAIELANHGHIVTGSDQEAIYPPFSTLLTKNNIPVNKNKINQSIDLCIIGGSYKNFTQCVKELKQIKKLKIPYISATKYMAQNIAKRESILVAGSFGKTTISSLLVWIFKKAKIHPSYMFGGQSLNKLPSLKITNSNWSILEACESINGLDTQAKFLYYPAKYVILTSVNWEHKESYKTKNDNLNAFKKLIKNIPKNGLLVYNPSQAKILPLLKFCKAPVIPYNPKFQFKNNLLGQYNAKNISAAATLCFHLGINIKTIKKAISSYKGIKRRLELITKTKNILFFDDFAQSPPRVKSSINAVKSKYPNSTIKVFFEPHAHFLQNKKTIDQLKQSFKNCQEVILSKIPFKKPSVSEVRLWRKTRVTAKYYKNTIGQKLKYIPIYPNIYTHYIKTLSNNDILIHMSSGGLTGIQTFNKIIKHFKHPTSS